MNIQYNDGPQAVRYLAKYLVKDDYEAKILLKNIQLQNQGYYKITSYVSEREHYSTRIVRAVEATYDLMGWRKHINSRNVLFLSTSLISQDTRRLWTDIKELDTEDDKIYSFTLVGMSFSHKQLDTNETSNFFYVEIYEKREGAEGLTMPQFFSFYKRVYKNIRYTTVRNVTRPYYPQPLPEYVQC